jgi:hypothetical protein
MDELEEIESPIIGNIKPSTLADLDRAANEQWKKFPLWIKYTCLFAVHIAKEISSDLAEMGRKR